MRGLIDERFLIHTHPEEIAMAARLRAVEPEIYLGAMQELWIAAKHR